MVPLWVRVTRWFVETWITPRQKSSDKATSDYHSREKSFSKRYFGSFVRNVVPNLKNAGRLTIQEQFLSLYFVVQNKSTCTRRTFIWGFLDTFFFFFVLFLRIFWCIECIIRPKLRNIERFSSNSNLKWKFTFEKSRKFRNAFSIQMAGYLKICCNLTWETRNNSAIIPEIPRFLPSYFTLRNEWTSVREKYRRGSPSVSFDLLDV